MNAGSDGQSKSGSLSVGSLSSGDINAGNVSASGNLNLSGDFNIQGLVMTVKSVNAGEDSYYNYQCRGYDLIMWNGTVYPWGVEHFKVNQLETCNTDYFSPYACSPNESRSCYDIYVDNATCLAGTVSAVGGYMGRNVTCSVTRVLTQK